jgi:hypothetical protein
MYVGNLFLGFNFGKEWFVGAFTMDKVSGRLLAAGFGLAFLLAWTFYATHLRRDQRGLQRIVALLVLIGAMTVMASLPGEARQEARWMYPTGVFVGILVFCTSRVLLRYALLGLILLLSIIHWGSGALDSTANVYVSRTAKYLGEGVNGLAPRGRHALLIGLGNNPWEVGELSGINVFAQRNFKIPMMLRVFDPDDSRQQQEWADLGIVRSLVDEQHASSFAAVDDQTLQMLLDPARIDALRSQVSVEDVLGDSIVGWDGWRWSTAPRIAHGQIILDDARRLAGFTTRPAASLDGKVLIYRARRLQSSDRPSHMRLQVNWMGPEDKFISTSIRVVDVGSTAKDFSMQVRPPPGAEHALIYANLHDGEDQPVLLQSVLVQTRAVTSLGQGADWEDWRWQGEAEIRAEGVQLSSARTLTGFREIDAGLLDNRLLVYRARLKDPYAPSKMRLQINWLDREQRFLGTSFDLVSVQAQEHNYVLFAAAPAKATTGLIYANLNDGEENGVVLESVDVVNLK